MEESPLSEALHQFEVNVFGAVAVIKAFLPYFRARRAGHILNVTSMGGFITLPGISYYCGSKFALQGISETLTKELKPFNIAVTAIQPGSFRTDWAGRSMVRSPRSISDYDQSFGPIRETREKRSGHQPGDPVKAAKAILQLINSPAPPASLLLGSDAVMYVREKLHQMNTDIDAWETLSRSTDS
ncbi:putative oxidoreductase SadH [compost metagenome]